MPGFVFIATLGQTDVQVVHEKDGQRRRFLIDKESQRAFHEACRGGAVPWQLVPLRDSLRDQDDDDEELDPLRIAEDRGMAPQFLRDRLRLQWPLKSTGSSPDFSAEELDCRGGVTLFAPLLA